MSTSLVLKPFGNPIGEVIFNGRLWGILNELHFSVVPLFHGGHI